MIFKPIAGTAGITILNTTLLPILLHHDGYICFHTKKYRGLFLRMRISKI